jgi:hypothetical protein
VDAKCWISADPSIADFNSDGSVDTADYVVLRKGFATGAYTQDDYNVWRQNFGAPSPGAAAVDLPLLQTGVPEPNSLTLAALAVLFVMRGNNHHPVDPRYRQVTKNIYCTSVHFLL